MIMPSRYRNSGVKQGYCADGYVVYADAISASLPRGWVGKQKQLD
jgi:hypothetical protein